MGRNYRYEYEYDIRYCYPGSNVLKNKLNITDMDILEEAERRITSLRTAEAMKKGIRGKFDFNHLKRIHKFLFGDIYDWAGKVRLVNISKGNQFCRVEYIEQQMSEIFERLLLEHYLKEVCSQRELAKRLSYYMGEINAIHPFREGNGRCQRMFIQLLSGSVGYQLDFMKISEEEMLEASARTFDLDYKMLEELIAKALSDL